jgi:hypothetical protein
MGEWLQDDPLAPELGVVDLPPEREYPDADRLAVRDAHMESLAEVIDLDLTTFECIEDQMADRGLMVVRRP